MKIMYRALTIVLLLLLSTGYVLGVDLEDNATVTGYVVNGSTPYLVVSHDGTYGLIAQNPMKEWTLVKFDRNMNLAPLASYRIEGPTGYISYPILITRYRDGFLITGTLDANSNSAKFHGGFWLTYIDKEGTVLWTRAYLTRYSTSISKVILDNSTGRILIIGSGSFYSGGDGFIGVFNPETQKLERLVALGGLNADRINDVLMPGDGTYIIVGGSWSLGDVQGKPFVVRLTKNFSVLNSAAFTLLDGGNPVKSADWRATYARYSNGTIRLFGKFLVKKYGQDKATLQKSGLWWMTLDENFNPISYSFKETTINSSPIELGYSGVFNMYHLPSPKDSMIVSGIYLNYDRFFVGWIHDSSIDGYFVNVNRSPSEYYSPFISPFTPVFTVDNSLILMLSAINYSDVNFKSYNPLLTIKIPYSKLHNPEALRKTFLYGGNFSVKLKNAGFWVKESRNVVPTNIKLLNVEIHSANISIVPIDSPLNIVELRNPKPMVKVEIFRKPDSSFPRDASIYIDGTRINISSDNNLYLLPGTHNLTVTRPGFISHNETINLQAFVGYGFDVEVFESFLQLSVSPENATVKVICPPSYEPDYNFTFNLTPGIKGIILPPDYHCLVTAVKEGYVPESTEIWTSPGDVLNLTFNLKPEPVHLVVISDPQSDLKINGKYYGETPQNLSLAPGSYKVVLSKKGYERYSLNVTFKPGEHKVLNVTLTPVTHSTSTPTTRSPSTVQTTASRTLIQNTTVSPPQNNGKSICGPALIVLLTLVVPITIKRGN